MRHQRGHSLCAGRGWVQKKIGLTPLEPPNPSLYQLQVKLSPKRGSNCEGVKVNNTHHVQDRSTTCVRTCSNRMCTWLHVELRVRTWTAVCYVRQAGISTHVHPAQVSVLMPRVTERRALWSPTTRQTYIVANTAGRFRPCNANRNEQAGRKLTHERGGGAINPPWSF